MRAGELRAFLQNETADIVAEASAHTTHFETVREPVVHKDTAR